MNNMTPGMDFPILYQDKTNGQRCLRVMKWGLIPSYTKPGLKLDYFRLFNARSLRHFITSLSFYLCLCLFLRSETVESKFTFRKLVSSQRCVVLLNGYYEWKLVQGKKQPYYVTTKSQTPIKVAAVYDIFQGGGEQSSTDPQEPLYSFTMLTCPAHDSIRWLHERQPLILSDEQAEEWIDMNQPPNASIVHRAGDAGGRVGFHDSSHENEEKDEDDDEAISSTRHLSYLPEDLISYTVTPLMTSPAYQEPESCAPYAPSLSRTVTSFFQK
jgi:putative SOS response-associated peptidase YedK